VTIQQALRLAREALLKQNIYEAPIESEVLLRHNLGLSRADFYRDLDRNISPAEEARFRGFIDRRLAGEPTAYITGHREFYGLDFFVDRRVLIPRPETETLVDEALKISVSGTRVFADIGTGSGAVAISIAVTLSQARIFAVDVSGPALEVAAINCRKHGVESQVTLLPGNLLEPLPGLVDVILANLPYVPQADLPAVNTAGYEPPSALDGGPDGLDLIRNIIAQASAYLVPYGRLLLEHGMGQENEIAAIFHSRYPNGQVDLVPDLAGIKRVAILTVA
jgi:release factor glutamine methyltransferase